MVTWRLVTYELLAKWTCCRVSNVPSKLKCVLYDVDKILERRNERPTPSHTRPAHRTRRNRVSCPISNCSYTAIRQSALATGKPEPFQRTREQVYHYHHCMFVFYHRVLPPNLSSQTDLYIRQILTIRIASKQSWERAEGSTWTSVSSSCTSRNLHFKKYLYIYIYPI